MTATSSMPLTVGQAASQSGVSRKAVRLYEERGLLPRAPRNAAGYRLLSGENLTTLRFIKQAQGLGLSLTEIGDVLELHRGGREPCDQVTELLDRHLEQIEHTIARLEQLRATILRARQVTQNHPTPLNGSGICPIIENATGKPTTLTDAA